MRFPDKLVAENPGSGHKYDMKNVAIAIAGEPPIEVAKVHGDYLPWYQALCPDNVSFSFFDVRTQYDSNALLAADALIVSGSPASVTELEPWMEKIASDALSFAKSKHVLGVCFGHQLLAHAMGATVEVNPNGWELGSFEITVKQPDALFEGLPAEFHVNLSHRDHVAPQSIPQNMAILASSPRCPIQAYRLGFVRGVQFHPEFSGVITRAFLKSRWDIIAQDAIDTRSKRAQPQVLLEQTHDSSAGIAIMANFLDIALQER